MDSNVQISPDDVTAGEMEDATQALEVSRPVEIGQPMIFTPQQVALMKRTIAASAELTDDEFALFLMQARRLRLDPFNRQIHAVKRWNSRLGMKVMTIQVGIDGYRAIADRTHEYAPGGEPSFVYDENGGLLCATAYIKKWAQGCWHDVAATAYWVEYAVYTQEGHLNDFWERMPRTMLAKVAEALALRKAFPEQLGGVYTDEEMGQADNPVGVSVPSSGSLSAPRQQLDDGDPSPMVRPKRDWRTAMAPYAKEGGWVHASKIYEVFGPEGYGYLDWLKGQMLTSGKPGDAERGQQLSNWLASLAEKATVEKPTQKARPSFRSQLIVLLKNASDEAKVTAPILAPLKAFCAEAGYANKDGTPNTYAIEGLVRKCMMNEHATLAGLTVRQVKSLVNYLAYIIDNGGEVAKEFGHSILAIAWSNDVGWKEACDLLTQQSAPADPEALCTELGTTFANVVGVLSEHGWPPGSERQLADFLKVCKDKAGEPGFALHDGEDYTRFGLTASALARAVAQQEGWVK